ncbi:MAG: hypothetical protein JWO38_7035 [Gemmataceae bacterium]|nr:hypothetical protein [Gemmataceae bacterium]
MFPILTGPHGRHGRSPFPILCTLAVVLGVSGGLALLGSRSRAADPGVGADPATPVSVRVPDVVLARTVLMAFDADPLLRDVNLVVSVVDGVAVVGGPVPTVEAAKRAGELVRTVREIKEVRNKCFVQAGPDPLLMAMAERRPPPPPRAVPMGLPAVVTSPKPGAVDEPVSDPGESSFAAVEPAERAVVARRPANPGDNVLLPPVGLSGGSSSGAPVVAPILPPAVLTSVPPLPTPAMIPGRPADALVAAEVARKSDRRFTGLTVEMRDGMLVIAGTAARSSDAWDLAQELRRIPGVARVAVGQVEVR